MSVETCLLRLPPQNPPGGTGMAGQGEGHLESPAKPDATVTRPKTGKGGEWMDGYQCFFELHVNS